MFCEMMGGNITVKGNQKGSHFVVALPETVVNNKAILETSILLIQRLSFWLRHDHTLYWSLIMMRDLEK